MSKDDNAFFVGVVLDDSKKRVINEYDDLWNTKELVWEKMYKILCHGKIRDIHYYHIKGKID